MPGPVITTSDAELSRLEGLYIKEIAPPVALKGVFLGVVAVAGEAVRGPTDVAVAITSPGRFQDVYGSRNINGSFTGGPTVPYSKLWTFMQKKPFGKLKVVRVSSTSSVTSQLSLLSGSIEIARVYAANSGSWGNLMTVAVNSASDGNSNLHFDLAVTREGQTFSYKNIDFSVSGTDNLTANNLAWSSVVNEPSYPVYVVKMFGPTVSGSMARPTNMVATLMVSGSDGAVQDTDYTATGRGLNVCAVDKEAAVVVAAEYESTALKAQMLTLASTAEANGKMFLIGPTDNTVSLTSAVTDVASYRHERLVYCFNGPNMIDPTTTNNGGAATIQTHAKSWMAAVLSQIDVDIDPGEVDTKNSLNGITTLTNENYVREDYITMRNAGIAGLERQSDGGFQFWSAVTTNLNAGYERITRRRMLDFLEGALKSLNPQVKKKNTLTRRAQIRGAINNFLDDLKGQERVVDSFLIDGDVLNTDFSRSQGYEKILVKVKLVSHILGLQVSLDASTGTNTTL